MNDFAHSHARESPLYPEITPRVAGMLPLDGLHTMYWEECGKADGVPLLFIHGGPGGGSLPHHRRFYDPSYWRIVLYDQRGAGRSKPVAELRDNTTAHLVEDIERLRKHLCIDKWLLFGGSWGSTLALLYAQAHPDRVLGLVLRGVFLATVAEIDWFMQGMARVFPEAWRAFVHQLPPDERADVLGNYYRRLTSEDRNIHAPAAQAWDRYEGQCSTLLPKPDGDGRREGDSGALAIARIEAHYFINAAFLEPDTVLTQVERIRHLPCTIVQGRYDIICPPAAADSLARAWPDAEYIVVPDAGHSVREPGITRALVDAVQRMRTALR